MRVSFDDPRFLDADDLVQEEDRVFSLCGDCRLCVKYCDSFPIIFDAIDRQSSGDDEIRTGLEVLSEEERTAAVDACFGCQLCYVQCPYTPDEGHEWDIDFPLLMLRAKAIRASQEGIPLLDQLLADPDRAGKMMGGSRAAISNRLMRAGSWTRRVGAWVAGIHAQKLLPSFSPVPFTETPEASSSSEHHHQASTADGIAEVVLFPACTGQWNDSSAAHAVLELFGRAHVRTKVEYPGCCGMPELDIGNLEGARQKARRVVKALAPLIREDRPLVVMNPTCRLMMRNKYPELIPDEPGIEAFAGAVTDEGSILFELVRSKRLDRSFGKVPEEVVYHAACHQQRQQTGFKGRDVLKVLKAPITTCDRCSCHDGTWSMKGENFESSQRLGKPLFDVVREHPSAEVVTECPLAALQIEQATGRKARHPAVVLNTAYAHQREDAQTKEVASNEINAPSLPEQAHQEEQ